MVLPTLAPSCSIASMGPGCGGRNPCETESPATSGMPSRSREVRVSRAMAYTSGTSNTRPTAKSTGIPTTSATKSIAQDNRRGPSHFIKYCAMTCAPPDSASIRPSMIPRPTTTPKNPSVLPTPSWNVFAITESLRSECNPMAIAATISARNGWTLKRAIRNTNPTIATIANRSRLAWWLMGKGRGSNRNPAFPRGHAPAFPGAACADGHRLRIQRNGRANVTRHAVETIADGEFAGSCGFDDHVLFAVSNRLRLRQIQEFYARWWVLRRDGFVAKVEAKATGGRFADHARQHERGGQKIQVGKHVAVTKVPEQTCARATFEIRVASVQWKSRRAAGDNPRHGQSGGAQDFAKPVYRPECGFVSRRALGQIRLMNVAVIDVQAP